VYGAAFTAAAPALVWITIGLIPLLSNSGRKVYLYASGGERHVVRWSAIGLLIQVCAGVLLMPALGSVGAAASIAAGEAVIWWPLRRATATGDRVRLPPPPNASADHRSLREGGQPDLATSA
jgi:peptidoglycan biosynthesis protein MviN/MurJ (putative lipid II flippase)